MVLHADEDGSIYFMTNKELMFGGETVDQGMARLLSPTQVKRITADQLAALSVMKSPQ